MGTTGRPGVPQDGKAWLQNHGCKAGGIFGEPFKTDMMDGKRLFRVFLVFLCGCCVAGCRSTTLEQNENGVIGYREYELLVASEQVPGLVWSCGMNIRADVYAVKTEDTREWEAFGHSIGGFEYESGYEYRIRISETDYLDYTMATPAWTEYDLLEILSKEKKNSDGLPEHFIPEWFSE